MNKGLGGSIMANHVRIYGASGFKNLTETCCSRGYCGETMGLLGASRFTKIASIVMTNHFMRNVRRTSTQVDELCPKLNRLGMSAKQRSRKDWVRQHTFKMA